MDVKRNIYSQFRQPHGPLGHVAGWIMARRRSNIERNLWTLDLLDLQPGQNVLEVGHGPGIALRYLLQQHADLRATGIDHSATMHRHAARRNRSDLAAGRLELLVGTVERCHGSLGTFDRIFSTNVAQFWEDATATLATLRTLLTPGGMIATTYMPRHAGATGADTDAFADRLVGQATSAGFVDVRPVFRDFDGLRTVCVLAS
ncbi:MAG: class I SAM-dependent methyltransferase [Candidatus Dadabacteria bacterium]|nr:MAG: class I SAM-dependent methyltransferase [Candidatus Dadabacteria bacterium]